MADRLPIFTTTLTAALREDLAVNAHNNNEAHLRCVCDDCVRDAGEGLRMLYADLSEAALYLPIPEGVAGLSAERFKRALHRLHVYCAAPAASASEDVSLERSCGCPAKVTTEQAEAH